MRRAKYSRLNGTNGSLACALVRRVKRDNVLTNTDIAEWQGVDESTVKRWLKGTMHPRPSNMKSLRDHVDDASLPIVVDRQRTEFRMRKSPFYEFAIDHKGVVMGFSKSVRDIVAARGEEIKVGYPFAVKRSEIFIEEDIDAIFSYLDVTRTWRSRLWGEQVEIESVMVRPDGGPAWASINVISRKEDAMYKAVIAKH